MGQPKTNRSILALADLATPMAIRVAATLSLVEQASGTGATATQLASQTSTDQDNLRRLLDHLVTIGLFDFEASTGRYRPTDLGSQMHQDAPRGVKPLLDINCAGGRGELSFVDLLETVTTGVTGYQHRYGREFWADLESSPKLRSSFDEQMNWRFLDQAPQIAKNFDWSRFPNIIDVGGGNGALLIEILQANPGVRGQILDLEPTAAAAARILADSGLADRAAAIAGSFFDELPAGADAYLLSDILHDWSDEHCRQILARCRDAAGPTGTLVVVEPVLGHGGDTTSDLVMMTTFNGKERTREELSELIGGCGFVPLNITVTSSRRMALEFSTGR